jgi:hypothetical protein
MPNNTVMMWIRVDGVLSGPVTYKFNGPTGSYTWVVNLKPGRHTLDGRSNWNTNQFRGGKDITAPRGGLTCNAEPALTVEKLQKNAAGSEPFTTSTLSGVVGEVVDYEVIAKNTGNVPLSVTSFTDAGCDEGTIAGGPGANPVAVGETTTWTCSHTITVEDEHTGSYTNSAIVTAMQMGGGGTLAAETNAVLIEPIRAGEV